MSERGIYKTPQSKQIIETMYRGHLASPLAAGLQQQFVETPFGKTFVLCAPQAGKPSLVLLHGSTSNSATWLGVIPLYRKNFSVYCLDIPGEPGLSSEHRLKLSSDAPANWLASTLDALCIERSAFVGMSLGGWYALSFAIAHPERVTALSLISSAGIAAQKTGFIFKALLCMMLGKSGLQRLNKLIYYHVVVPEPILEQQSLVAKHFNPVTEALALFSDEQLKKLTMPLQYFGGAHDVMLDTAAAVERLHVLLPNAQAHLLQTSGHAIIDKFEAIEEFLSQKLS